MRLISLDTHLLTRRYDGGLRNTLQDWNAKHSLLVRLTTDNGLIGMGEAWCDGGAPRAVQTFLEQDIAPRVVGQDPRAIGAIWERLWRGDVIGSRGGMLMGAIAGVDIALWDLLGKITGQPVHRLLGAVADRVTVYGSGGMYGEAVTPAVLAEEARGALARGMAGIKIKGAGGPIALDVARARAVREAIGPEAMFIVDAMFTPDVAGAIRLARALRAFELHFLEAPTLAVDRRGWATIRRATGMALAGPELEWSQELVRDFVVEDAIDLAQFDIILAGGITGSRRMGLLAHAFHKRCTLHCAASAVGVAASAHLGAALPNCDSLEFHLLHQSLHERLWANDWRIDGGALVIPDRPGLGLDIEMLSPTELDALA